MIELTHYYEAVYYTAGSKIKKLNRMLLNYATVNIHAIISNYISNKPVSTFISFRHVIQHLTRISFNGM